MEIVLDKKKPTLASLSITLTESDYQDQVSEKIKEYTKKANIKGFRPGKVPTSVIKNMMGDSLVADEVFKVLNDSINNYIKENNLSIIGDPLPTEEDQKKVINWKTQKEFDFNYELGLVPEFKYDLSDKLKFTKYVVDVDQKLIDETIATLQKNAGEQIHPDEIAEDDFVSGTITQGDYSNNSGLPLTKMSKKELKKFIGAKKGDEIAFDVQKAFDKDSDHVAHVTGKTKEEAPDVKGDWFFTIENITRSVEAEVNQEFFDKVLGPGAVASKEEFDEKLKEAIAGQHDRESVVLLNTEIKDKLLEKTKIEVSSEFLKRWLLTSNRQELTEADLEKDYENYENELKWQLLRNRIAKDLSVTVEDEAVQAAARAQIQQQFLGGAPVGPEMEETFQKIVENYLREDKGKNYLNIYEQVMADRLFTELRSKVTIKDKKTKSDDLKKIIEKAQK